jgi:hypothetical protein
MAVPATCQICDMHPHSAAAPRLDQEQRLPQLQGVAGCGIRRLRAERCEATVGELGIRRSVDVMCRRPAGDVPIWGQSRRRKRRRYVASFCGDHRSADWQIWRGVSSPIGTFGAPPARRADRRLGTPDRLDQRCRSVRVGRVPGRRPRTIDDTDDRVPSDLGSPVRGWRSGGRPARRVSGRGPCRGPCAAPGR